MLRDRSVQKLGSSNENGGGNRIPQLQKTGLSTTKKSVFLGKTIGFTVLGRHIFCHIGTRRFLLEVHFCSITALFQTVLAAQINSFNIARETLSVGPIFHSNDICKIMNSHAKARHTTKRGLY